MSNTYTHTHRPYYVSTYITLLSSTLHVHCMLYMSELHIKKDIWNMLNSSVIHIIGENALVTVSYIERAELLFRYKAGCDYSSLKRAK